jgi:hypothetical protein
MITINDIRKLLNENPAFANKCKSLYGTVDSQKIFSSQPIRLYNLFKQ